MHCLHSAFGFICGLLVTRRTLKYEILARSSKVVARLEDLILFVKRIIYPFCGFFLVVICFQHLKAMPVDF